MQKLVYYAQGFHLAITGTPLFEEQIEAWRYGPVVPGLYRELKQHGDYALPLPKGIDSVTTFTQAQREILDEVYSSYGQFSAWKLRDLTHDEAPWKDADARGDSDNVITHEALRRFFRTRLKR